MTSDHKPTPEAVRAHLAQILLNAQFRASDKQRKFVSFVVDETLSGRSSQLKGYTIAVAVYGRNERFDPQVDPIVRVEAGRLRRALEHYYLTAGKNETVRIQIPKGSYVPTFHTTQVSPPVDKQHRSRNKDLNPTMEPSIAVMPLINLNGDPEQEYFTDGLTEELTAELTRYQDLQVIASQSTMRFKSQKVDPREIGRDIGVRFLLAGSIRHDSKSVKVTIQLLDTSNAEQIWGESYKRDQSAAELIAVQEEIASKVIGTIADGYGLITQRMSEESRKKAPVDLKAYDATLRFYYYETELTPEAFKNALAALERAVQIEPEYGLAWAMLAHLHADNHALGFCEIEAALEKALTFAQKGVALAPKNQFALDALALVYFHQGDRDLFIKHVEETIALNPNSPYVIGVAGWHMTLYGVWDRGLTLLKKGMELNPYYPTWFHLAPFMDFYRRGLYEKAFLEAMKFNYPKLFWDPLLRAAALGQMGKKDEAQAAAYQLLKLVPDFITHGRSMINRYVKVDLLIDTVIKGLQKAGLSDIN